jgi:hypothetical protein
VERREKDVGCLHQKPRNDPVGGADLEYLAFFEFFQERHGIPAQR